MIAVIFQVKLKAGCQEEYHRMGRELRNTLTGQDGFLGGTSFVSPSDLLLELSINYWKDEAAVERWRNDTSHRFVQKTGRKPLFDHYQVTVSRVLRSYTDCDRQAAPEDSNQFHIV